MLYVLGIATLPCQPISLRNVGIKIIYEVDHRFHSGLQFHYI